MKFKKFLSMMLTIAIVGVFIPSLKGIGASAISFTPNFEVNSDYAVLYNVDIDSVVYQKKTEMLERLLNETHELNGSLCGKIVKALVDGVSLRFNDREIARLVRRYA